MNTTLYWLTPVLWAIGILLPAIGVLSLILFGMVRSRIDRLEEHMNTRLQTLGHEDREVRQQIHGIFHMMLEIQKECHRVLRDEG